MPATTVIARAMLVGAGLLLACCGSDAPPAAAPAPSAPGSIEVMVLGTFHMGNPESDVVNATVDDVTSQRRQRELAALADQLARFRPSKILVEVEAAGPDLAVVSYRSFTPATLATDRNEIVQVGFRLARKLGHAAVYGIDERGGPGEPDYFPFDKVKAYAEAHGRAGWLDRLFATAQARAAAFEREQPRRTISELLAMDNDPAELARMHAAGYYELLKLGDGEDQPGADLNAMWYLRNAKMFSKLAQIARPGDRVLVLIGAGHAYWLRHFAEATPGFRFADPLPYLR